MNMKTMKKDTTPIYAKDIDCIQQISNKLLNNIPTKLSGAIVIVCIGTDRSTGDSLGPLVGTFLSEKINNRFYVYGTLEEPIHAVNLHERIDYIKQNHPNAFIIAVDACLGKVKNIGTVQVCNGPLKPGAGVNKQLPEVGDVHITGIVNVSGFMEFFVLQNTRLSLVMKMAKIISESIFTVSKMIDKRSTYIN